MHWVHRLRAEHLLVITFAGLILFGAVALWSPLSAADQPISFLDCLFTATSAVCVTGLVSVDTGTVWSLTGLSVILLLIQLGGLGIMTFTAAAFELFRRRISVISQAALSGSFFEEGPLARAPFWRIVKLTLAIELVGAIVIYAGLPGGGLGRSPIFDALFLSVSAYCNAGFVPHTDNAIALRGQSLALWSIAALIVAGGLGYSFLFEVVDRARTAIRRQQHTPLLWTLHSRIVWRVSAMLIVGGGIAMALTGMSPTEGNWLDRAEHALFHSISARTAGFNTADMALLPLPTILILVALMFIGGSPGSCAGGIKTTTFAVGAAAAGSGAFGGEGVSLFGRRIPADVVQRAALVIGLATLWQIAGIMVLSLTESGGGMRFEALIFEQVSAFNTVGLSMNVTAQLSPAGKLWIILSMFVGRVGPLTVGLAVLKRRAERFSYPAERVMIG